MKLFWRLQNTVGKTSFFDCKSLLLTITRQILKHLWRQNKFVENAYYFCWKYDFFGRELFPPYFLQRNKIFVTNKLLFMTTEEKLSELLTLVMAFMRRKYQKYFFYGVSICDKNSSIVNIKENISNRHKAIENGKIFWRENSPLSFHICDDIYRSQLLFFIFLIEFVFATNMLTIVNS